MEYESILHCLQQVASGSISPDEATKTLVNLSFEDIDYAHIDHQRSLRKGFPEVIYGQGKTTEQIVGIMEKMIAQENVILVTRVSPEKADSVRSILPETEYHSDAKILLLKTKPIAIRGRGTILVISAGTSDIPIAKEAGITASAMGNRVETIFDVGVAGIHRLLAHRDQIAHATVIIVVAGMEGALPSVVAGMVSRPIIAVPTSIGYGTSFGGLTALLAMLNSCSSNVAVVNIDNGFGAGYMASTINQI